MLMLMTIFPYEGFFFGVTIQLFFGAKFSMYRSDKFVFHHLGTPGAVINTLNAELNPICYLLALLGAHHFLHVSRIRVKSLTLRLLMSYIYMYGAPILDVSRSHTTYHSR